MTSPLILLPRNRLIYRAKSFILPCKAYNDINDVPIAPETRINRT